MKNNQNSEVEVFINSSCDEQIREVSQKLFNLLSKEFAFDDEGIAKMLSTLEFTKRTIMKATGAVEIN